MKKEKLRKRVDGTEILIRAVRELSQAKNIGNVTEIVREAARQIVGSQGATFVLREGQNCYYVDESAIKPLWKGKRFPMNDCLSGWVMKNRQPVIIPDVMKDERVPKDIYRPTFVKSMLMVPIGSLDPLGAIGVYWSAMNKPTMKGLELINSLADITSVAIDNIQIREGLEQRVKSRTSDLEEMNNELETFSYSVSHDLRAPLRAITGFASILEEEHGAELSEAARELLGRVNSNAVHMTTLLDDLLTYFRTGKKELVITRLPAKLIVCEIADDLQSLERGRKITIEVGELPDVSGDALLFRQLWQVLISNALKFSEKCEETFIHIGCEEQEEDRVFYIRDNGCGFDMNYYKRLFGVFQRLHSQREFSGSGIGLALAKKIVQKHQGRIWADSRPDTGTTFYFTLYHKKGATAPGS